MPNVRVIDIGPLFDGPPEGRGATDRALWDAFRETGSVTVVNVPDGARLADRARDALRFYELPDEAKRAVGRRTVRPDSPLFYRGYHASLDHGWAYNEIFDIGSEAPVPGPDLPRSDALIEHTPWPDPAPFPEWRSTVRAYYDQMDRIARAVMLSVGRSSGFDDAAIAERLRGANSTLRLINYPARPEGAVPADTALSAEGQALSARRHTDQSGLSLLWQAQPGLQAEAPSGDWYDVPLVDGGISVHLGDMMGTLTRGAARPTPHRVLSRHTPRQSIGFFLEPALSAPLTPADVPVDETTVRDTYAWALLAKLSTYPQYKGLFQSPE